MAATAINDQVEQVIVEAVAELGPDRDQVTRSATFEDLDIDSLDLVEIAQVVEEELGVVIRGEEAAELKTVGDAIDLVVAKSS